MTPFNLRDIDDLRPQERRYDVPIEDDFVVSVLPNGIRTWVYVYEQDGRLQRRTLGIYPDMGFDLARQRLAAARTTNRDLVNIQRKDHALTARTDVAREPASHSTAIRVAVLVVAVIVAIGIYLGATQPAGRDRRETAGSPVSARTAQQAPATTDASITAPVNASASASTNASTSPATTPTQQAQAAGFAATPAPEPVASTRQDAAAASHESPVNTSPPRVTRALLTSDVVEHEPVDTIGPEIVGDRDDTAHVCFYTELHGLSGQQVRYRWEREGRVESENTMLVGTSWRWRAYSRKEILPGQTGQWRVQLMDAEDRVLAEASFVYRTDALDAQAAEAD
jgi:hypothetical protein